MSEELPTALSEEDALALENVSLKKDLYEAQAANLQLQIENLRQMAQGNVTRGNELSARLREKYKIGDGDSVDVAARTITRKA
jgi:hypothetical protein